MSMIFILLAPGDSYAPGDSFDEALPILSKSLHKRLCACVALMSRAFRFLWPA